MKKNAIILSLIFFLGIFTSCSYEETSANFETSEIKQGSTEHSIKQFMLSIDSVNSIYTMPTRADGTVLSKSNFEVLSKNNAYARTIADAAGYFVGKWSGKYIGSAVGGVTGNPVGAITGYLIGRKYGGLIMSKLCSYVAYRVTNNDAYVIENNSYNISKSKNFIVYCKKNDANKTDSIGIYHNAGMGKMIAAGNKYDLVGHRLNYDLMYEDCVINLKEEGVFDDSLAKDSVFKADAIRMAKETAKIAKSCFDGTISANEMYEKETRLIQTFNRIDKDQIATFEEYSRKVSAVCGNMTPEEMESYASDLSRIIQNSSISDDFKSEAASTANIILNSTYYWKE